MAIKVRWKFSCSVFICIFSACSLKFVNSVNINNGGPSTDFTEHGITKPRIYHGRTKREISTTADPSQKGGHSSDLIVSVDLNGVERILELTINHDLISSSYFEKSQSNGSYNIHKPTIDELELCHYRGFVRHIPDSWAAISTCSGLKGIIKVGKETFFIDKGPQEGVNYVYNGRHLRTDRNQSCGFSQSEHFLRLKRDADTDTIRGPFNATRQSRYVELLLVVDHEEYKALGDLKIVYQHCKDIANIINALFTPLNIFIALIGVVVWTEKNEITLSTNGDKTLTSFLHHRKEVLVKEHPNDNAQLLTRIQFEGGVVGKALKGPICTYEYSGGIFMDHSSVVGLVATTVAHELGHNFGMEHDREDCECPDDRCIMASSSSALSPSHWSSCSLEFLAQAFEHGMDYCLRNKPTKLFDSPVCGNGFVEPGEQCDCGLPHRCNNTCCNATTCMLYANASCATGSCCDFQTCKPKNAGSECRSAEHECDLPEYCTGESEYCPTDVFKIDGESCNKEKAFCYQGKCRSHSDQCQLLWGPSGKNSDSRCYDLNIKGNMHGNCGYNRQNRSYVKCANENIYCGMVQCTHYNEKLEFGMESVSTVAHLFINIKRNIIPCRTVMVDMGLNEVDPGLAPDGAKCGEGKMCVNQKCMSVGDLKKMTSDSCPKDCNGNGICNSKGHCHCNQGFAPPFCDYPGTGGSTDSGPASDPNLGREVTIALYITFLVLILLSVLAFLFIYYTRHNVKIWWKKSPPRHTSVPWDCKRQPPARSAGTTVLLPESVGIVDVGIIRDRSPGPKATLLNEKQSIVVAPVKPKINELQSELLMKGKGFTIKPLKKANEGPLSSSLKTTELDHDKSSSILTPSYVKYEKVSSNPKDETVTSTDSNENTDIKKSKDGNLGNVSPYPGVHFTNPRMKGKTSNLIKESSDTVDGSAPVTPSRPKISNPVLEDTTAKNLIAEGSSLVPTRKAPKLPIEASSKIINNKGYDKELPPIPVDEVKVRPLSSPVELADEKKLLKELKESKEYPALTKIASLMKSSSINRSSSINEKSKAKVKPEIKKLKFDRDKLKNIEISNPIPQLDADSTAKKDLGVTRAQSMREPTQPKTNVQTFGSMRVPSGTKRPSSVHVPSRPTSPPPRPPPPKSLTQEDYPYDDCLNLLSEKTAPLAHIDEENSPTGNIYAVIEESPKPQKKGDVNEKKVHFDDEKYEEPIGFNSSESSLQKNKALHTVPSGSTESMGLLGEIVSEIQARNLDSIYSSGTLKKKKDKEKQSESEDLTNLSGCSGNVFSARSDSSSSSNGYINPNKINSIVDKPFSGSIVKSDSAKQQTNLKDINKKGNVEGNQKINNLETNSYKPYSSSLVRSSGPLANSYKEKMELKAPTTKDPKKDFLSSNITEVAPSTESLNTPSSASPFVKSSFTRNVVPGVKPLGVVKPSMGPQKPTPPKKYIVGEKDGESPKPPNRPLPSIPTKIETKPKPDGSSVGSKAPDSLPRKNSKENLRKIVNGKKPPTEAKPELGRIGSKKNSKVGALQSKFEGNELKKQVPSSAVLSKTKIESKTGAQ